MLFNFFLFSDNEEPVEEGVDTNVINEVSSDDQTGDDKSHKLWQDKARELGYEDPCHVHKWWIDIKDQYVKLDKKDDKSGDGGKMYTDRQKYILSKVSFYRECMTHRRAPVVSVSIPSSYIGCGTLVVVCD